MGSAIPPYLPGELLISNFLFRHYLHRPFEGIFLESGSFAPFNYCSEAATEWHSRCLVLRGWPTNTRWTELGLSLMCPEAGRLWKCSSRNSHGIWTNQQWIGRLKRNYPLVSTITKCTNINSLATNPGKILKPAWARELPWQERKDQSLHGWKECPYVDI